MSSLSPSKRPAQVQPEAIKMSRVRDDSCTDFLAEESEGATPVLDSNTNGDNGAALTPPVPVGLLPEASAPAPASTAEVAAASSRAKALAAAPRAASAPCRNRAGGPPGAFYGFGGSGSGGTGSNDLARQDAEDDAKTPEAFPGSRRPRAGSEQGLGGVAATTPAPTATATPAARASVSQAALATPAPAGFGAIGSLADDSFEKWKVGPRYKVSKVLGHGSYGQVAEARDLVKNQKVAIKCIGNVFDQEIDTKRILREVYILRHLKHDNVVKLLDIVTPSPEGFNEIYLVFDFVDTDLHKLINSPQYLTIEHVRTFLYQMLCALKYIHSSLVIHRDIKPANILLNEDCGLKICDFGLARVVRASRFVGDDAAALASEAERAAKVRRKRPRGSVSEPQDEPPRTRSRSEDSASSGRRKRPQEQQEQQREGGGKEARTGASEDDKPEPKRLTRQLTKHVVTRWYRPPELILLQEYTNAVDMWSVGCIFAELLSMQKDSVKSFKDRTPLFPGKSCFPLSADNERTYKDRLDQLNVIFGIIGTPKEADIEHLGDVKHYLRGLPAKPRRDFSRIFKAAPPDAIDLLDKMLVFDPRRRLSVDAALDHAFLKSVRVPAAEIVAPEGLLVDSLDAYDLTREELRQRLLEEIKLYSE